MYNKSNNKMEVPMKKRILWIFLGLVLVSSFMFAGCNKCGKPNDIPSGNTPTKEFSVDTELNDNAVYRANTDMTIQGTSEEGVVIIVEIGIQDTDVVQTYYSITNESDVWKIEFKTPKISKSDYQITIRDHSNKYVKKFTNINFGVVWMLAGDGLMDSHLQNVDEVVDNNVSYYEQTSSSGSWIDFPNEKTRVTKIAYKFGQQLQKEYNCPIGIIMVQEDSTTLEEWVMLKSIENNKYVKEYMIENDMYNETPKELGDMSYLAETKIKAVKEKFNNLDGVLWMQGKGDASVIENVTKSETRLYANNYHRLIQMLVSDYYLYFGSNLDFVIIQTDSSTNDSINTGTLRILQNKPYFEYQYCKIIPTYDLNIIDFDNNTTDPVYIPRALDLDALFERINSVLFDSAIVSGLGNVIFDINDDEIVDKILIEISKTKKIYVKNNYENFQTTGIHGLNVYYRDDSNVLVKLDDLIPTILENRIVINLAYSAVEVDEDGIETEVIKYLDKSRIVITYAYDSNAVVNNLYNDDGLPILSFVVDYLE